MKTATAASLALSANADLASFGALMLAAAGGEGSSEALTKWAYNNARFLASPGPLFLAVNAETGEPSEWVRTSEVRVKSDARVLARTGAVEILSIAR